MNLTITPVSVSNTPSYQNYTRNNNSQNQNFGALTAQFKPQTRIPRNADILLDKFLYHFENAAKRIGLDTQNLEKKGYSLFLDSTKTEDMDYGMISGVLKKNGEIVKNNGKSIDCIISDLSEDENAQFFAKTINGLNLTAIA